jgi:AraC-like DNA-binding protein
MLIREVSDVKLEFNRTQLLELMRDFYTLSGIRMVLFDDEYHEYLAYPEQPCKFCGLLKANADTKKLCDASDARSFQEAAATKKLILFHCHAGLIEATIPLEDNHILIGYLMFGQISDLHSKDALRTLLQQIAAQYGLVCDDSLLDGIPRKSDEQIHAAAKIMEACTHYALLSQAVGLKRQQFNRTLRTYLLAHLNEPLQAHSIAAALGISRSKLYQQCEQYLGMGIGTYLKKLRMEQAQTLVCNTELPVAQISDQVGFADYTYFCRVFKQETGLSVQQYRRQHHP